VLFVSHNIAAVLALTRRCILLRDGHIGLDGNTVETTEEYLKSWQDRQTEEYSNASRPSAEHGAKIRIERIAIVGASAPSFKFGDPIGLRVSIRSTINKEGLFFGLTMESTSSIPILTGASDNVVAARAGSVISYEITLSDSRLSPGHYVLHLSVADGSLTTGRRTYDLIRPGPTFTVEPLGEATGTIFNWDQRAFGSIVHPGSAISVRILAPSEGPIGSLDVKQVNADPMWNRRESIRL
jgi:ABC-type molybdate transport system ATPase subunit